MSEIRRLQSEMSSLEDRVQTSAKIMGAVPMDSNPKEATPAPDEMPQGSKDK